MMLARQSDSCCRELSGGRLWRRFEGWGEERGEVVVEGSLPRHGSSIHPTCHEASALEREERKEQWEGNDIPLEPKPPGLFLEPPPLLLLLSGANRFPCDCVLS
jgi:hypothetical protein